jgi:hypothetical protein
MMVMLALIDSHQHVARENPPPCCSMVCMQAAFCTLGRVRRRTGGGRNIARCLAQMHGSSPAH